MASRILKIAHISSEVGPYAKTGGLGDVVRTLPRALKRLGHEVIIIAPYYRLVREKSLEKETLKYKDCLELDGQKFPFSVRKVVTPYGYPIFFIAQEKLFGSRRKIYYGYPRDGLRFLFFNLAALKVLEYLKFAPDVIHCHDWQAGIIPNWLKVKKPSFFCKTAIVYTIHNLLWQGPFDWWKVPFEKKDPGRGLPPTKGEEISWINFAKRAILYADVINAVSERYSREILTPKYGEGLDKYLRRREDSLYGIVNGIDYRVFNPLFDKNIYFNYDFDSLDKKMRNKRALQRDLGLEVGGDIPMIGMANRLTEQKGFELIMKIIEPLLRMNLQIVIVGSGSDQYRKFFRGLAKKYPKQAAIISPFSEKVARRVYAASDMYLMPSRFEPCGISQMISLRYGSVPIVHETGGLSDTITDFNPKTGRGNGFIFRAYKSADLLVAIARAVETHKYARIWEHLTWRAMKQSFSWEIPAKKYITLYRKAIKK